ncbi:MAG TPA: ABC transporter substrate-binding protein [Solirubrobacteraceae bacterium]|nr:ABC transporter substrate-binding protein [Solirubrobacteraceae bacterium]
MRASTCLLLKVGAAAFCAAALAACGSNRSITLNPPQGAKPKPPNHSSHTVYVYSSLPLKGSQRQESNSIIDGIRLALAPGHVGDYTIKYKSLDDSVTHAASIPPAVSNAQTAARNSSTVAYIGDLDSGATELSLPILNQAGIVQITPGSGYPGLTNKVPHVTGLDEPLKFYPTGSFTLLRLIPDDMVQAAAALELLRSTGCTHVAAASFDGGIDGPALVKAVQLRAKEYGMAYVAAPGLGTKTSGYPAYALKLRQASVGCFVLAGHVTPAAVALTQQIHIALPTGAIIGSSGFCSRAWTDPARHGVSAAVDPYLYCTSPLPPPSKYQAFITEFRRVHHRTPGAYALIGYRAARMVIDGLNNLGSGRDNRKEVLRALIGGVSHPSLVAGNYGFDARGNLTTHAYAIYNVVDGRPSYDKTLTPPRVL